MKSYEKQLEEFGYEIADEIVKKEKDSKYEACLDQYRIARSLSSIHDHGLRKTTEDLDKAINRALYKMRNN
jgi:hypothetical protein